MSQKRESVSQSLWRLAKYVMVWRIVLTLVVAGAIYFLPYKPSFPFWDLILIPMGPRLVHAWGNFDGVHYLVIATHGYQSAFSGLTQAFFPLYPLMIRWLTPLVTNMVVTGVVISTVCFWLGLVLLERLLSFDEKKDAVRRTVFFLIKTPTSFFFTSVYNESLFFLLMILTFYWARSGRFWWAGIFGALATATRIVGVFLIPAIIVEFFQQRQKRNLGWSGILAGFLPLVGIGSYMYYLKRVFGDPLLFYHVQSELGVGRENRLILFYQVLWRYGKMLIDVPKNNLLFYTVTLELASALVVLGLLIWAAKKLRSSYVLYGILAFLAPTLTGTFTSMPRYVLVLFPAYIIAAREIKGKRFFWLALFSGILLIINTALFIQGYWVA